MTATATDRLNDRMDRDNGFAAEPHEETSLAILNRTEIDQQIATAKRYPRSIARAKQKMIEMATNDQETAQGCVYALKRNSRDGGSNFIEGPSIRLAEIAINAWGNIRAGARVIGEENGFIVAQGVCHDLEANSFTSIEVRRRITNKEGRRYSDDMIGVTANAACAIALRNAVFKIVPKVFINPAYIAAQKLIAGDEKSIGQRRQALVEYFGKIHIGVPQIMQFLDKSEGGVDDITGEDLVKLHGVATAIRDGDTTIDEAFPPPEKQPKTTGAVGNASALNAALDAGRAAKPVVKGPDGQPVVIPPKPDPEAAERILREKSNTNVSSPDTPGGDAENDQSSPAGGEGESQEPHQGDEQQQPAPEEIDFSDAVGWKESCLEAMAVHDITPSQAEKNWRAEMLKFGKVGKESEISADGRQRIYAAAVKGEGNLGKKK